MQVTEIGPEEHAEGVSVGRAVHGEAPVAQGPEALEAQGLAVQEADAQQVELHGEVHRGAVSEGEWKWIGSTSR